MASRIMHLAVGRGIEEKIKIKDVNRFRLGIILPDAYNRTGNQQYNSHLKETVCKGKMVTYNLEMYRELYQSMMLVDSLYLGYYMHLVQDLVYRAFVYNDYKWNPSLPGNVNSLHNDYSLLNTYVIEKYKIVNNIIVPKNFKKESINKLYPFAVEEFLESMNGDFEPYYNGSIFFFTESMVDEFVNKTVDICLREVESLYTNKPLINSLDYVWKQW